MVRTYGMLVRTLATCLLFILFTNLVYSQSSEIGLGLGVSGYKGDLNKSLYKPKNLNLAGAILFRHSFNSHWSYRLNFNIGTIEADDADSNDDFANSRNLSFKSNITELHLGLEFNFFPFQTAKLVSSSWTPFLFAGIAGYRFNPKAEYNGDWYELQPLNTEGQGLEQYNDRKPYKRLQMSIPFGGGFKFRLGHRWGLVLESGARRTFTDYLDDVSTTYVDPALLLSANGALSAILSDRSDIVDKTLNINRQRGNASDKDWYMFTHVTLSFTLSKKYNDNCLPFGTKLK
ncbi:MAG TPA: DUF6089 family protein [Bacteroidia bacterium]|nr:DUF6089 family protein [Bacteroidia bacterium]